MPSLAKMWRMCVSVVFGVTYKRSEIPRSVRPSAISGAAFGHAGDGPGYRSVLYARPNGRKVAAVMVNIDATRVPWAELEAAAERALCR
jgi:hypothetical protein